MTSIISQVSCIACALKGLGIEIPVAPAPDMGLNAYFSNVVEAQAWQAHFISCFSSCSPHEEPAVSTFPRCRLVCMVSSAIFGTLHVVDLHA